MEVILKMIIPIALRHIWRTDFETRNDFKFR